MWPFTSTPYPTRTPESVDSKSFDYIVVGGGTAGCVVASRLSENPNVSVLLIERGPVVDTWASRVPAISVDYRSASSPMYKWLAAPLLSNPGGAALDMMSGKLLGGSSKVNANLYTRSVPGEYNAWVAAGRQGWEWDKVEAYFRKSERSLSHYDSTHRGAAGPWKTRKPDEIHFKAATAAMEAADRLGIPFQEEFNDPDAPPYTSTQVEVTIDEHGRRVSTFDAFLPKELALKRQDNLFICVESVVSKIDIQSEAGVLKAAGVYFQRDNTLGVPSAKKFYAHANREVILCAGAIVSPQVLLLSGVGPADHLDSHDIPVVKEMPGVGSHLQDHVGVAVTYDAPRSDTMFELEHNKWRLLWELLKYIFTGRGLFLFPLPEIFLFALSKFMNDKCETVQPEKGHPDAHLPENVPDIEIMQIAYSGALYRVKPGGGATSFLCVLLKPKSTGTVRLASRDPNDRPDCQLGFLTNEEDYIVLRKAVRLGLALGREMRNDGYPLEDAIVPDSESAEDLDKFIRRVANTTYHYSSTCRMAPEAEGGVVDDELRVHGIQGLRVADASVFPTIPAAHLQAPTVMIAERCADFVKYSNL